MGRGLEDAAGDPAMTLVVDGVAALESREAAVLRLEGGLQVGGIVNRMRPGVTREQLEVTGETLAEVDGQSVVPGIAIRDLGVHAVEGHGNAGDADGETRRASERLLYRKAAGQKCRCRSTLALRRLQCGRRSERRIRAGRPEVI